MLSKVSSSLLAFWLMLMVIFQIGEAAPKFENSKIDHHLEAVMNSAAEDELINAYVVLNDRLSLEELQSQTRGFRRKERQKAVMRILKDHAAATQSKVLNYLQTEEAHGAADRITSIWAINRIAFRGTRSVISRLVQEFLEIEKIRYDAQYPEEFLIDEGSTRHNSSEARVASAPAPNLLEPADPTGSLILINVPQVWAQGDSGQGVLVANIDTGTDWTHPDLANNIWNNLGEDADGDGRTIEYTGSTWVFDPGDVNGVDDDGNGYTDDFIGWDLQQDDNDPIGGSHGTKIAGIVAGDGTDGTQTGIAPKAKLMTLKLIFNEHGGESVYWAAEQYALDMGADIITSALSYKWWFNPQPDYAGFRDMAVVELAAGVVHTNSSSNNGDLIGSTAPLPFNISTPGNCPSAWLHPDQTLVGGLTSIIAAGNVNAGSDAIVSNSPYGPSTWEDYTVNHPSYPWTIPAGYRDYPYETNPGSQGLLKPDVSAPGDGTRTTRHGGGYVGFSGTSGASAHLAGTAALLLSANPDLTPANVSRIMQQTAVDKGAPGKDDRYGAGRIDAYQAYLEAVATSVQEASHPAVFALEQNYPNPFNPSTTIQFSVPRTSEVEIKVFTALGEEVSTLVFWEIPAGTHSIEWNASGMASGVYFYRMQASPIDGGQAGGFFDIKKLLVLK